MTHPSLTPVVSSALAALGYDAEARVLYIRFNTSTKIYAYAEVSAEQYSALFHAESVGKYFNQHIKPIHEFTILEDL